MPELHLRLPSANYTLLGQVGQAASSHRHTHTLHPEKHELASQGGAVTPLEGPGYTRGTTPSSNTCTITRTLTNADPACPRATSGYYLALSLRVHYYPKTPGTPRA